MEEEKTEMQKALELVEKDKVERQQRAWEKLSDFIIALEKEENVYNHN